MKKRLLSALLALALVFVLLPTTALAEVVSNYFDCDISILGNYWKFEKDSNNEYLPVYYRSEASSFEDSTIAPENNYLEIRKTGEKEITITVHGDVNITATGISIDTIAASKSVIINGNGHLTVKYTWIKSGQNYSAIDVSTLTVEGVALSAEASMGPALSATYGIHIKDGAMVEAKAGYYEAVCEGTTNKPGGITVDNATLVATATGGGNRSAIKTYGDIAFTNAKVTATNKSSENAAIQAKTYEGKLNYLYVSGTSTITATNQSTSTDTMARAIGATIKNNNTSEKIEVGSSKVDAGKTWYTNAKQVTITSPALETTADVLIAKESTVVGVRTSLGEGNGYYTYNKDTKTLTLEDVSITSGTNAIQFTAAGTYTVNLEGTNTISNVSRGILAKSANPSFTGNINVILSGSGSLDISAKGRAIEVPSGNLTFNNTGAITLATTNTANNEINAINASGKISIGNDFNRNLKITADNGAATFDPTNQYTVYNDLKNYKSISFSLKDSTISYGGTTLTQGQIINGENGGTATVAPNGNTITLNNFNGTKALSFDATLADSTLVLEGTNTLSSIVTTQKGLTISGSGSLTAGSIRVTNNDNISADLTINGGAHVTVNRPSSEDEPAVEVSGNLTVTGDGTQLSAECTAATNPAIEVGGNVTISGNPGTNAYTVKAYNKYATQRGRDDNLRPSQMPSAFEISGNLSISGSAQVMAQTDSDGAAVWMPKEKVISVADASLIAQNRSHNFSTISFGDESNMGNIYAKGQVNIVAENMLHSSSSLAHRAIKAYIYNHYNTGDSNPYYIKVVSEGVQSGGNVNVIPGHCTSTGGYKVTITRGDAYTTPQVAANYTIAGQTMYVGKYYKTDANGNITEGTAQDYNIYCDSKNDFTLNNATISSTGTDVAINTNIRYETNVQHHIKLIGTNRINNTFKHAISGGSRSSTIIIESARNASDASLIINGNYLPIYSDGKVTINAEVVIVNTTDDNSFKGLISTSDGKGAFDLGSGYKCYASTSTTGTPLEEFNSANYSTYKYLRVTTQTLETGGGSTHQHTWDTTKWYDVGEGCHARKCTGCDEYDLTNKQAHYAWPDENKGSEGHTEKCMLCDYKYDQSVIKPHEWTGWWVNDYQPEVHTQRCNCGYLGSTHRTLKYVAINGEQHQKRCPVDGCDYKIESSTTAHVYAEGSNICTECGYDKSAPCDHTGDRVYTNNGDGTHKVTCNACGATIVEKQSHEFDPTTGACIRCGATQSGGNPTPDNPGTIVIIRPAEEEKPAQQPNPSTGANDLVGMAVAAAVVAVLGSVALLRKHD